MFDTILKNIDIIESNKTSILNMWMEYEVVENALSKNTLKKDFFQEKFASKVFDFTINVVNNKNDLGNCPVIGVMLILFKKKNIPLSDIFIICVHLKNSLLHFLNQKNLLDDAMIKEISVLMDYNFEGVIREYTEIYYKDSYKHTPYKKVSNQTASSNEISTPLEVKVSTSASAYLQEVELDMEMIDELDELESDTLNAIDSEETINRNSIDEASNLFNQYSNVLNSMYEFEELAYTLTILKDLLLSTEIETLDEETGYMISIYLKAIISDLQSWRMSIFITNEAEDIHYLDKTLLSSIAQLQITLLPQDNKNEEEIEFF